MQTTERAMMRRVERGQVELVEDVLVVEKDVMIELNGKILLRTTCSPSCLYEWVLGFLLSEGYIAHIEDIRELREDDGTFSIELAASAPSQPVPLTPQRSSFTVDVERLLTVTSEVTERAKLFKTTGGTHAMAIGDRSGLAGFVEDISRSCALEKVIGDAVLRRISLENSFIILSSRVSTRMLAKIGRSGIPIVGAISAPTIDAVRLAKRLKVCLCGFVRVDRLNVYSHRWRVGL